MSAVTPVKQTPPSTSTKPASTEVPHVQFKQVKPTTNWLRRPLLNSVPTPPGVVQSWFKTITRGTAIGALVTGAGIVDLAINAVWKREESSWLRKWAFPAISLLAGTSLIGGFKQTENSFGSNLVSFGILNSINKVYEKLNEVSNESIFSNLFNHEYLNKVKNTVGNIFNGIFNTININEGHLQKNTEEWSDKDIKDAGIEFLEKIQAIDVENNTPDDSLKLAKDYAGILYTYCNTNPSNILGKLFSSEKGTVRGSVRELTEHVNELLKPVGISLGLKYSEENNLFEIYIHTNELISDSSWKNAYKPCIAFSIMPGDLIEVVNYLAVNLNTLKNKQKTSKDIQETNKNTIQTIILTLANLKARAVKVEGGYSEIDKLTGVESGNIQLLGPLQYLTDESVQLQVNKLLVEVLEGKRVVPTTTILGGGKAKESRSQATEDEPKVDRPKYSPTATSQGISNTGTAILQEQKTETAQTLDDILNYFGFNLTDEVSSQVKELRLALVKAFIKNQFETKGVGEEVEDVTRLKNSVNDTLSQKYPDDYSIYKKLKITNEQFPSKLLEPNNLLETFNLEKDDLLDPTIKQKVTDILDLIPEEHRYAAKEAIS